MNNHPIMLSNERLAELDRDYIRWFESDRSDSNFTALLFALIIKADITNASRLAASFPEEVYTVAKYQEKPVLRRFTQKDDLIVLI